MFKTVDGDDVMVISGLLTPDLGVWWTPTGGGDTCVTLLSDTQEVDMIPPGSLTSTSRLLYIQRISISKTFPRFGSQDIFRYVLNNLIHLLLRMI